MDRAVSGGRTVPGGRTVSLLDRGADCEAVRAGSRPPRRSAPGKRCDDGGGGRLRSPRRPRTLRQDRGNRRGAGPARLPRPARPPPRNARPGQHARGTGRRPGRHRGPRAATAAVRAVALWTLWEGRRRTIEAGTRVLIAAVAAAFALLLFLSDPREVYALPLLLPLALLAGAGVPSLRRGAANALAWFGAMSAGLLGALMWLGWFAMMTGFPPTI